MLNISEHLNPAPKVQLFNLREDIGETENLVETYPEKAAAMESELREWLTAFHAGMPYNNAASNLPGRVEAKAVPGMTHAVFCLIDENNFLFYSEPLPSVRDYHNSEPIVPLLKNGYAYKPGLVALIKHAESAMRSGETAGVDTRPLAAGITEARRVVQQPVDEALYSQTMHDLALRIRAISGIPEAKHDSLIFMTQQPLR